MQREVEGRNLFLFFYEDTSTVVKIKACDSNSLL